MRLTAIVVLVSSLAVSACNQAPPASTAAPAGGAAATQPQGSGSERTVTTPAAPPTPTFQDVTVPEGTELHLVLDTAVGSDTSKVEDPVRAHLSHAVEVEGVQALPVGSTLDGVITVAERSGKVKGVAQLAFNFVGLTRAGGSEHYRIDTSAVSEKAASTKKKDTVKVAAPAVGGAIVGGIIGGGKGAAIGTAVGAGAGGAVVLSTRGKEVRLARGAAITVRLAEPLVVRVPRG